MLYSNNLSVCLSACHIVMHYFIWVSWACFSQTVEWKLYHPNWHWRCASLLPKLTLYLNWCWHCNWQWHYPTQTDIDTILPKLTLTLSYPNWHWHCNIDNVLPKHWHCTAQTDIDTVTDTDIPKLALTLYYPNWCWHCNWHWHCTSQLTLTLYYPNWCWHCYWHWPTQTDTDTVLSKLTLTL